MTTAIIGIGNIGKPLAQHLVSGGEPVIVAARDAAEAAKLADELGAQASAASVSDAIASADTVVFAVWLDTTKALITEHQAALAGKVVVDPSNPVTANDEGEFVRTLPDGQSAGALIAGMLPHDAHFVKAFGSLPADALASGSNRSPRRAALYYATDDDVAEQTIERLIQAAGFDAVKAGGVDASLRIEVFGDLHPFGGLNGLIPDADEARTARGED